jgi:hypothetical protein
MPRTLTVPVGHQAPACGRVTFAPGRAQPSPPTLPSMRTTVLELLRGGCFALLAWLRRGPHSAPATTPPSAPHRQAPPPGELAGDCRAAPHASRVRGHHIAARRGGPRRAYARVRDRTPTAGREHRPRGVDIPAAHRGPRPRGVVRRLPPRAPSRSRRHGAVGLVDREVLCWLACYGTVLDLVNTLEDAVRRVLEPPDCGRRANEGSPVPRLERGRWAERRQCAPAVYSDSWTPPSAALGARRSPTARGTAAGRPRLDVRLHRRGGPGLCLANSDARHAVPQRRPS